MYQTLQNPGRQFIYSRTLFISVPHSFPYLIFILGACNVDQIVRASGPSKIPELQSVPRTLFPAPYISRTLFRSAPYLYFWQRDDFLAAGQKSEFQIPAYYFPAPYFYFEAPSSSRLEAVRIYSRTLFSRTLFLFCRATTWFTL